MWESSAIPDLFERYSSALRTSANIQGGLDAPAASALGAELREIINAAFLPRLLRQNWVKPARVEPEKLARLLIAGRNEAFRSAIGERLAKGTPKLAIMTGVLAPTARELGRLWDNDDCDLIDVQRATGSLKRWIAEIAPESDTPISARSPSILVQAAPGERHTLGVDMAEALFRDSGWRVTRGEVRGFLVELAEDWRDVIGFSLSCDRHIEALGKAIAEARQASRNPRLLVFVGGPIFVEHPDLVGKLGADFCASTAEMTVKDPHALLNGANIIPLNTRC